MACSLKSSVSVAGLSDSTIQPRRKEVSGLYTSSASLMFRKEGSKFFEKKSDSRDWNVKAPRNFSVQAQASFCVSRAMRWWEKTLKPNMIEIHSAQELVDSLKNAGDRLVIVDFYSPGCGGCKTLHPKICQLAESHPDAIFLKVNYEELKPMCHLLHIHVLPFFRFYRGAQGRVSSFSCTIATIKKFKDALAKHGTERCSLGPAKGLDESELIKLASAGEISINVPSLSNEEDRMKDLIINGLDVPSTLWNKERKTMEVEEESLIC